MRTIRRAANRAITMVQQAPAGGQNVLEPPLAAIVAAVALGMLVSTLIF